MKISLVSVLADEPVKAFRFYTDVLGLVEKMCIGIMYTKMPGQDPNQTCPATCAGHGTVQQARWVSLEDDDQPQEGQHGQQDGQQGNG